MESWPRRGFTLIELLIVVAIIAILAAIAVPNFLEAQTRSKVSRAKNDMRSVAVAIESMRVDRNGALPLDFWDDDKSDANERSMKMHGVPCIRNDRGGTTGVLMVLTTPIAYMTSVPEDIFSQRLDPSRLYPTLISQDWQIPRTFVYVDNDPYWDGGEPGSAGLREGDWKLVSAGPDRGYEQYDLMLYDATNGTVSVGDLIYNNRTGFRPYD